MDKFKDLEGIPSFKIIIDSNVLINLLHDFKKKDTEFYRHFKFLVRNKIFIVCYTNFNLVEIAQANQIEDIFGMYSVFRELENLEYFNHDTSTIEKSSPDEFLQRALYKFFEFGNEIAIQSLGEIFKKSDGGELILSKYIDLKNSDFLELDKKISKKILQTFQETLGLHKGEYNHLSPHEAEVVFRDRYRGYFNSIKHIPDAEGLPEDIFSEDFYATIVNGSSDKLGFELFKLTLIEFFGYKQKKLSKIKMLNSLVDNHFVSISTFFNLIVTNDKDLEFKINKFQTSCKVLSLDNMKKLVFKLINSLEEIRNR